MLRDVPIRFLVVAGFLVSGLVPLMAASLLSLSTARDEQRDQAFRHLESVRDIKAAQLERFFDERVRHLEVLAGDPYVRQAVADFEALRRPGGFADLGLAGLGDGGFDSLPGYRSVHDRHAGWFGLYADRTACYDVFLMDPDEGFTYFTVRKEADFGVALARLESPLRDAWQAARDGRIAITDTRLYAPSRDVPAQFLAAPVVADGRLVAIVAVQLSLDAIDGIMGERSGMGRTGETYVVGSDFRMRSDASLDPRSHGVVASFQGTPEEHGAPTEAVRAGFEGRTGSLRTVNYRGEAVLTAFAPVRFQGVTWVLVADVAEAEIEARIAEALDRPITWILVVAIIGVVLLALAVSLVVSRGIRHVLDEMERLLDKVLHGRLDVRGDRDNAPVDFREVVDRTNQLVLAFEAKSREQRRLEAALEAERRMQSLGTLAGGIAHDFNNILTYMYNYTMLLEDEVGPAGREHLAGLENGIERASELVAQILAFGRPGSPDALPVKVSLVVKEALKLIRAGLPGDVRLVREVDDEPLWVAAEPGQLLQVVTNLCTNAWQAMGARGGTLRVTLRSALPDEAARLGVAGDACILEVADTGPGMDDATREHAFEPFFTTKPVGEGTGMGLAVVHGIVRRLGGGIRLDSVPGSGTAVIISLPLCAAPERVVPRSPADPAPVQGRGRILLVDDEPEICASASPILVGLGYEVRSFTVPAEAEAAVRTDPGAFDVVLTDLAMPGMDGIELATALWALRPDLPVILVTGFAQRVEEGDARIAGLSAVVQKPWDRAVLSGVLASVLESRRTGPAGSPGSPGGEHSVSENPEVHSR